MLDGQGADELLGGYHGCFFYHYRRLIRSLEIAKLIPPTTPLYFAISCEFASMADLMIDSWLSSSCLRSALSSSSRSILDSNTATRSSIVGGTAHPFLISSAIRAALAPTCRAHCDSSA
jgi:hypothetical protein